MKNLKQLLIENSKLTWPKWPEDWLGYNCLEHEFEYYLRNFCTIVHTEEYPRTKGWSQVCSIPDGDTIRYFKYSDVPPLRDFYVASGTEYEFDGIDNVKEVFKHETTKVAYEYLELDHVKTHKFTLVLLNQKDNTQIEKILYDAGCNDGLLCYYGDTVYVEFEREGEERWKLIKSAMKNLRTVASIYSIPVENVITQ